LRHSAIVSIVVLVRYSILLDDALIENFKSKAGEHGCLTLTNGKCAVKSS